MRGYQHQPTTQLLYKRLHSGDTPHSSCPAVWQWCSGGPDSHVRPAVQPPSPCCQPQHHPRQLPAGPETVHHHKVGHSTIWQLDSANVLNITRCPLSNQINILSLYLLLKLILSALRSGQESLPPLQTPSVTVTFSLSLRHSLICRFSILISVRDGGFAKHFTHFQFCKFCFNFVSRCGVSMWACLARWVCPTSAPARWDWARANCQAWQTGPAGETPGWRQSSDVTRPETEYNLLCAGVTGSPWASMW